MLGSDDDVAHARAFGGLHPGVGVEVGRIPVRGNSGVLIERNFRILLDPFSAPQFLALICPALDRIDAPMQEQAELRTMPSVNRRLMRAGGGSGGGIVGNRRGVVQAARGFCRRVVGNRRTIVNNFWRFR
jgi:hypothetical protein